MLVLSRRIGETVVIEGGIRLTVVSITGNKVRLGINAPDGVRTDRLEVHERRMELTADPDPVKEPQPLRVPARARIKDRLVALRSKSCAMDD